MADVLPNATTIQENATAATNTTMADGKPIIPPEGQLIAYSALYLMALTSIYFGSFRSAAFVRKHQRENKKIENSIGFDDAKWFPITASSVLFGLYLLFRMDQMRNWAVMFARKASPFLPEHVSLRVFTLIGGNTTTIGNSTTTANGTIIPAANQTASYVAQMFQNYTGYEAPTFTKQDISYFLLVFFCWQGVFAMAYLAKPIVVFLVKILAKTRLFPLNRYYQLVMLRSNTELPEFEETYQQQQQSSGAEGDDETAEETSTAVDGSISNNANNKKKNNQEKRQRKEKTTAEAADVLIDWRWDRNDLYSVLICSVFGVLHVVKRHWLTNNAFGLSFSLYGIEALHLNSFKGGVMLLAGLFVYDIFWVFATDVMSTVATSVNAPILLMFPQDILINGPGKADKFAMLGLGDIVIPGVFLALLLRYGERVKKRSYFYATLAAYGAGLLITIGVMHYFKAAQPALLYLVPTCVGMPCVMALFKGDWSTMIRYSEEHLVKKPDEQQDDKKNNKNKQKQKTKEVTETKKQDGGNAETTTKKGKESGGGGKSHQGGKKDTKKTK